MKAPSTRSLRLAIGTNAPSPQVLVMAILGGAGLAAGVTSFSSEEAKNDLPSSRFSRDADETARKTPHIVPTTNAVPSTLGLSADHSMSAPPVPAQILSTSSNITATSDVSAERSASLAAAARLSRKSSAFSIGPLDVAIPNTATGPEKNAAEKLEHINNRKKLDHDDNNTVGDTNSTGSNSSDPTQSPRDEDSYPAFTPFHRSLLRKYLTPAVWAKLSGLQTSYGTTIEDIVRAGLALPIGANPPRRVGVLVGDAECYQVFRDLLDPIISEYHGIDNYEEWNDPELPMERYFSRGSKIASVDDATESAPAASASAPPPVDDEYGVIKSNGAAEDSDDNDDSSFLLDEEDDMFVEYVALPSSPSAPKNNSLSTSSPAMRHVQTIASKRKGNLRRHPTIINNPRLVTNREADPDGKYIVSARVRVARSLDGVKFPMTMSRSDRRKVQRIVGECTRHFQSPNLSEGLYLPVLSMSSDQNLDLIERHVLFDNPNEWTIASGLGRDWPDGRALYANVSDLQSQTPDFMIWVNEEDHLRIMCMRKGGDIQGVFTAVMTGVRELERELTKRGWHFAYDPRLGYLTSCPTNVGTTMRASVHVRLTNLGRLPGFFGLVQRLKLEARGKYGETDRHYTGVFDISNAERLGKSEVHLINVMVEGVAKLIELERRLEAGEVVNIDEID